MPRQKIVKLCPECGFNCQLRSFYCPACGTELESSQNKPDYKVLIKTAISLSIEETKKLDSEPNIVRINDDSMRKMDLKKNDAVVLMGKKVSAGIVRRTVGLGSKIKAVRVKALMRSNLGKKIGESVRLNKIEPKIASEITLLPYQNQNWLGVLPTNTASISRIIRKKNNKIPLTLYDKISLSSLGEFGRYTLIVASIKPRNICFVSERTNIIVLKPDEIVNYKTAIDIYRHVLNIDETDIGIYISLVNMYFQLEDYKNALSYLDKILSLQPSHPFATIKKGTVLLYQKNFESAIPFFEEILQQFQGAENRGFTWFNYYLRDALNKIAVCYASLAKYEPAIEYFEKLLEVNPKSKDGMISLGVCYFKMHNTEKALFLINKALKLDFSETREGSQSKASQFYPRLYYRNKENFDKMEQEFNSYNVYAWKVLGEIYLNTKEYDKSEENFSFALKKAPRDSVIWLKLGLISLYKNELTRADKHLKMALRIDPESVPAKFGLARVYYKNQDYENALELTDEVLKIEPNDEEIKEFKEKIVKKLL